MSIKLVVFDVDEVTADQLPQCELIDRPESRQDLMQGVTAARPDVVILDIDQPQALNIIIELLEISSDLGVVGITAKNDLKHVIAAQRAGCHQIVTAPVDLSDLKEAIQSVSGPGGGRGKGQIFTMFGAAGGAGTTTIASHLAVELAEMQGEETLAIDLDLDFGGLARSFDLQPRYTISDVASAGVVDPSMVQQAAIKLGNNVSVLARPHTVGESQQISREIVGSILEAAEISYRYTICDIPRKIDEISGIAIENSDKFLIVLQLTVPSIESTRRLVTALNEGGIDHDRIELVINRFRKNVHGCTIEMVEKQFGKPVYAVVPNDYQAVSEALDVGKPLTGRNPVRSAIRTLAEKLAGKNEEISGGWFSSFRKVKN